MKPTTLEHERERVIGTIVKFKKVIKEDCDILCKKLQEQIINVDNARTYAELTLVLLKSINEVFEVRKEREDAFKEMVDEKK